MAEELKTANFEVTEFWSVTCPECDEEQEAPFNEANPRQPMAIECEHCWTKFILTYKRDT
jgi:ribosomal protein S27E